MGCLVAFGTAVVGCNQRPNIAILHAIGAFMAFLIGAAYCGMATWQTFMVYRKNSDCYPLWFVILRATLTVLEVLSVLLMLVFSSKRADSRTYATLGNSFEWAVVGIQCIFYSTMSVEFSNIKKPSVEMKLTK